MKLPESILERKYEPNKSLRNMAFFASFCFVHQLCPADLAQLMIALNKCVNAGVRSCNYEDSDAKKYDRLTENFETMATSLGFTDIEWPGLLPTAKKNDINVWEWPRH